MPLQSLNLGGGVQSTVVAHMSDRGEIEPFDMAIFCDVGGEPDRVYAHLNQLCGAPIERRTHHLPSGATISKYHIRPGIYQEGILKFPVHIIAKGDLELDIHHEIANGATRSSNPPCFTQHPNGQPGRLNRKCTGDYKVRAIESYLRQIIGAEAIAMHLRDFRREKNAIRRSAKRRVSQMVMDFKEDGAAAMMQEEPTAVYEYHTTPPPPAPLLIQGYGISVDEVERLRDAGHDWIQNRYPLALEKFMTRFDCEEWLIRNGLPVPEFSACVFCPFNGMGRFKKIKENADDWRRAVAFDKAIRHGLGGVKHPAYLLRTLQPLENLRFDDGQEDSFLEECSGHCGV